MATVTSTEQLIKLQRNEAVAFVAISFSINVGYMQYET